MDKQQLEQAVATVVARLVPEDVSPQAKPKSLRDAVWSTVDLAAHEVALLDTPLLQRLRQLRQLGSAHLLYPGAQHTRFEHTIGVVHLTTKATQVLASRGDVQISQEQIDNLRLAALCHDLGHGPFSHCSEIFFAGLEPLPQLLKDSDSGAAELLSAMIVTSAPFVAFLNKLNQTYGTKLDAQFIAAVICGQLPPELTYLGELVHGPFDTDKLDYLVRDSQCCGIHTRVDVDRIIAGLDIATHNGTTRLVGLRGSVAALMQLVFHRNYLFVVVYHHHLCRSFTAMLNTALILAHREQVPVCGRVLNSPADFIDLDDAWLLAPGAVEASTAADMFAALRNRKLYKTAGKINVAALSATQRQEIAANYVELDHAIAKRAGLAAHEVIVDIAARQHNEEVAGMLISSGKELVPLGEVLALETGKIPLHHFLEQHLILCPAMHVDAVAKASKAVLADLVPAAAWA